MRIIHYIVAGFEGDYVNLIDLENPKNPPNPVAVAMLPEEIKDGSKLKWEDFQYAIE